MSLRDVERGGKRVFDIVCSASALLVLAPVLGVTAILVRRKLGRPVLFRQTRTGRDKQPFTIVKFRTMTDERDGDGALLPDSERLTPLGRLLRATSLDESPELWNVLKGDMSLVGPRPLLPRYDEIYTEREAKRFDVLPGVTGWAQINGRNDIGWDDRLACDVWYVEHRSLALDLRILLLTVLKVLRRSNVQADPDLSVGYLDEERHQASMPKMGAAR